MEKFNYEEKIWGANKVRATPFYLGALRIKYALSALRLVRKATPGRIKLLEVGCGGGGMAKAIKYYRPDIEVYACDVSKRAINEADKNPEGVNFKVGNVYSLPFGNSQFDAVLAFDLFEHLEKIENAIKETRRVLKKGGILHFYSPVEGEVCSYIKWLDMLSIRLKENFTGHIQRFTINSLRKIVEKEGFRVIAQKKSGYLIYQFFDMAYFSFLTLRRKNIGYALETLVEKKKNPTLYLLKAALKVVAILNYLESSILQKATGIGVHLSCMKK